MKKTTWSGPIPCKDDLEYILGECYRDSTSQRQLLERAGAFWDVQWQTVLRWMLVYSIVTPYHKGPRGPYKKA